MQKLGSGSESNCSFYEEKIGFYSYYILVHISYR